MEEIVKPKKSMGSIPPDVLDIATEIVENSAGKPIQDEYGINCKIQDRILNEVEEKIVSGIDKNPHSPDLNKEKEDDGYEK